MANKKLEEIKKTTNDEILDIFKEAISNLKKEEKINIALHTTPDPDAISSAYVVKFILNLQGFKNVNIYHYGEISHMQNITMNNIFHIELIKVSESIEEGKNICLDCTPKNSCVSDAYLIIDHHENDPEANYVINKPNYGSCATIIWNIAKEYINESDLQDNKGIASTLLIGVRTDTKDMSTENIANEDFIAWQELYNYSDKEKVQKVINYEKPRYYYEKIVAMNNDNIQEKDGILVGGVGYVSSKERDVIAMLADEYLRMSGITTTVIFSITDGEFIELSMRTKLSSLNVSDYLKKSLGKKYSGGKSNQGGARIPLSEFFYNLDEEERDLFWELIKKRIFKIFLS